MYLEKAFFREHEFLAVIAGLWYKIKHQLFKSSNELNKELKRLQDIIVELGRERSVYDDKRHTATNRLNLQNRALSNIKNYILALRDKKKTLFKSEDQKFSQTSSS